MRSRLKFRTKFKSQFESMVSSRLLSKPFLISPSSVIPLGQIVVNSAEAPTSIQSECLRVISLNVAHGRRKAFSQALLSKQQIERNLSRIGDVINSKSADVIALQEADAASLWSGRFDHVDYLRQSMELSASVLGCHMQTGSLNYGTAIISRSELHASQSIRFEPTPPTTTKGFVVSELKWQPNDKVLDVSVVSLHLDFARPRARRKQVDLLIEQLKSRAGLLIVCGDMNCGWQSGKSQVGRLCDELGLVAFNPTAKGLSTFAVRADSKSGVNTSRRLDWILVSKELMFNQHQVLPETLSDHQAIFAEIKLA